MLFVAKQWRHLASCLGNGHSNFVGRIKKCHKYKLDIKQPIVKGFLYSLIYLKDIKNVYLLISYENNTMFFQFCSNYHSCSIVNNDFKSDC